MVADGSLSAAARRIGYSQPTLGRHIEALEQQLGLTLFDRTLQGLKPTETALRLYQSVQVAEAKLAEAALVAEGQTGDLEGTVRITASTIVSTTSCRRCCGPSATNSRPSPSKSSLPIRSKTCCCANPTSPSAWSGRRNWN